jgi:acyl carrier protein
MTATESTIREFLVNEVLYDRDVKDLKPEDPLIARGLLDSLSILKTVTFCEERFGISIPDHDVLPDHFETVRAIAALVDRMRANA